ncbi:TonB-dependent receptor domain-containing protein [Vibrio sp. HN007]|uniref:TonB-dependent receptor domain-containing protein n=1 Tax=Vibrio iocasae TaxID=3098914 RepID=UPI0035D478C7
MPKAVPFALKPTAVVISAILSSLTFSAVAEEQTETPEAPETVQVWGTEINNSSSMLKEDIEMKQADHLSDLLRDQAGVDIGGTHSTFQSINIRGSDELDLNITIDGMNQNNNMFHHSGNLLINADILKAVDVSVGTNSVLTGGLSGGIAFETKDAKDLLRPGERGGVRLYGTYGSNDYYTTSATAYAQLTDKVDAMVYFTYTDKDNFQNGAGDLVEGNEGTVQNGMAKVGWDINESNRLEFSYDQYVDEGDYYLRSNFGGGWNQDEDMETQPTTYQRNSMALNYEMDYGDDINMRATLYRNELLYTPDEATGSTVHTGFNALAESNLELAGMTHSVRYGMEGYEQVSSRIEADVAVNEESVDSFAIYAEDEIGLTNKFYVTPGVRYNYYKANMESPVDEFNETFEDVTWGLAAKYLLTQQWTLKASATELFEGPALRETYMNYNTEFDDDLQAETGVNTEVGVAYEEQYVAGLDYVGFSVTLFETNIDNYIDDWNAGSSRGDNLGEYKNEGDYEIKGYESTLTMSKSALDARLTYSHSDSESKQTGEALRYEVGDSLSFNLGYAITQDLTLNWNSLVAFDLDKDVENDTFKEGYDVHNVSLRWMPMNIEDLTVTAGIENIFNEQYYSHASYTSESIQDYEPGRNVKLSASYVF